jgi:hypothetical protein
MLRSRRFLPPALLAGAVLFAGTVAFGCKSGESSVSEPDARAEDSTFTALQVAAIRAQTGFDSLALAMPGVVSVGIAGTEENAWIQVMCADDSLATQAHAALGGRVGGVPVRFGVAGTLQAAPPDNRRPQ